MWGLDGAIASLPFPFSTPFMWPFLPQIPDPFVTLLPFLLPGCCDDGLRPDVLALGHNVGCRYHFRGGVEGEGAGLYIIKSYFEV